MNPLLVRAILALGIIILGIGLYWLANRVILARASNANLRLEGFQPGKPAVLYFTMQGCVPCQTTQRPALQKLAAMSGEQIQIIEVDVVEQPELAEHWGVLSVPTTFIIDAKGRPRRINHGVALTEKLIDQLEQVLEHRIVYNKNQDSPEIQLSASRMD